MLHQDPCALVGIVPRKKLWSLILEQKWYHIPVNSAPNNIKDIKYLAFYFPAVFGKDFRYTVRYFAAITDIEIKKRIQLFPQEDKHPRHNSDYFQLFLDEIKELPRPIPTRRWRRVVHIPITLKKTFSGRRDYGERYHTLPDALTRDRIRNNHLTSYGWSVLRFLAEKFIKILEPV